jgi:iron complex transport system permease protein
VTAGTADSVAVVGTATGTTIRPARVHLTWIALGVLAVAVAAVLSLTIGAVSLPPRGVLLEVLDRLPGIDVHSGLSAREAAIVWDLRLPRLTLGLLVGAMLALSGASYQGVFRNPLADPYLLGAAAGAGLGATLAIVGDLGDGEGLLDPVPLAAFAGAIAAAALTYALGTRGRTNTAMLILAGVAVASFLTAIQTYVQQRNADTIREVYSWLLGRLVTAGWSEVLVVLPYVVITAVVLLLQRRTLDVMAVGDDEAEALGLHVRRTRLIVLAAASLGTAAAVAVSGLIAFVGIIVPHTVRLVFGASYRVILPLSILFGGAFLALADLLARTVMSPSEVPIGVITAFFGAPFFVVVLRTSRRLAW